MRQRVLRLLVAALLIGGVMVALSQLRPDDPGAARVSRAAPLSQPEEPPVVTPFGEEAESGERLDGRAKRSETGSRGLTPDERAEIEAVLDRAEHVLAESHVSQEEMDRLLITLAKSMGIGEHVPPPPPRPPPLEPTVDHALPRALTWLAATQQLDGSWNAGVEADTLATRVITSGGYTQREAEIASFRILLWQIEGPETRAAAASTPRETAIALYAHCALVLTFSRERNVRGLEGLVERLVAMRNPGAGWGCEPRDGTFDALATGWAIVALNRVVEIEDEGGAGIDEATTRKARIQWSAMGGNPERTPPEVAAALLCRLAAGEDSESPPIVWRARRLTDDLGRTRDRSLDEWFLGAMALKPDKLPGWDAWRKAMLDAILRAQRSDASWADGAQDLPARVRATALAVLCLRVVTDP